MQARDIMSTPVVTTTPSATIYDAMRLLIDHRFAALPVVDEERRVVGMFSESDALRADSKVAPVESVMTAPAEVLDPTTETSTIATRMLSSRLRSMPVAAAGILIGIVGRRDLLRTLSSDDAAIEANVRSLLERYVSKGRTWQISVSQGRVEINVDVADRAEDCILAAIANTVGGVRRVEVVPSSVLANRP